MLVNFGIVSVDWLMKYVELLVVREMLLVWICVWDEDLFFRLCVNGRYIFGEYIKKF